MALADLVKSSGGSSSGSSGGGGLASLIKTPSSSASPTGGGGLSSLVKKPATGTVQDVQPVTITPPKSNTTPPPSKIQQGLSDIWGGVVDVADHIAQDVTGAVTKVKQTIDPANNVMQFNVGENMTPEQTQKASEMIADNSNITADTALDQLNTAQKKGNAGDIPFEPVATTEEDPIAVKIPFSNSGFYLPSGNKADNFLDSTAQFFTELPETVTNDIGATYNALVGKSNDPGNQGEFSNESYLQRESDFMDSLQQNTGLSTTQSEWLGSLYGASSGVLDFSVVSDAITGGASALASQAPIKTESQVAAWEFLGKPKTTADAETAYRNLAKITHPDNGVAPNPTAFKTAADSIAILRKSGLPNDSAVSAAAQTFKDLGDQLSTSKILNPFGASTPRTITDSFTPEPLTIGEGSGEIVTPKTATVDGGVPTEFPSGSAVGERDFVPLTDTQAGFINPSEIGDSIKNTVTNAKEFLEETQKGIQRGKNISDDFYKLKQASAADAVRAKQMLLASDIPPETAEKLYNYEEDPTIQLTDKEQEIYDKEILPLKKATDKMYADLVNDGLPMNSEDYTPRIVKDKGGIIDRMMQGIQSTTQQGSILSKSAGFLKKRTIKALVDEDGNRIVASIKNGEVTQLTKGGSKRLGALKIRKKADLLEKEIKPIQNKINKIQRDLDILRSVKEPISPATIRNLETDVNSLAKEIDDHVGVYSQKELKGILSKLRTQEDKLDSFVKINEKGFGPKSTLRKISAADRKMRELVNYMADLENKYNPDELNNKVFVDNEGNQYRIKDATTKEIEANTSITYHKNVQVNRTLTYLKLRQIDRATQFMEQLKASPDFSEFAMKSGEGNVPKGWKPVTAPQFRGYVFSPDVADAIDQFANGFQEDPIASLTKINHLAISIIFTNPITHIPNLATNWLVNRGVMKFLMPKEYISLANNFAKAYQAVTLQNKDFVAMLDSGAPLMSMSKTQGEVAQLLLSKMSNEIISDPVKGDLFAKAMGFLNPIELAKSLVKFSDAVTWMSNDLFTMQAIYEQMDKGATMEDAIANVGKFIPNYRLPATALPTETGRTITNLMRNPNVTNFSTYHYGTFKSLGNILKDVAVGSGKERVEGLDKIAMIAFLGLVVWPLIDTAVQHVTHNKKTYVRRSGVIAPIYNAYKLKTGQMTLVSYLESILTPAQGTLQTLQLALDRDFYTGNEIYSYLDLTKNPKQFASDIGSYETTQVAGLLSAGGIASGKQPISGYLEGLAGIYTPTTTASERAVDELYRNQKPKLTTEVKQLYIAGNEAEAVTKMTQYNNEVISEFMQAAQDEGTPMTRGEAIGLLKKQEYLMEPPKGGSVKKYQTKQTLNFVQKFSVK